MINTALGLGMDLWDLGQGGVGRCKALGDEEVCRREDLCRLGAVDLGLGQVEEDFRTALGLVVGDQTLFSALQQRIRSVSIHLPCLVSKCLEEVSA